MFFTGPVDSGTVHNISYWLLQQAYADVKKVKLYISSTGGDMDSAFRLYDLMKSLSMEIETVGFGQVASAAVIIFLGGSKRTITDGCSFVLHGGIYNIGVPSAPIQAHKEAINRFNELYNKNISIIAKETQKSEANVKKIIEKATLFTSNEAKKFGLVHSVSKKLNIPIQTPTITQNMPLSPASLPTT